MSDKGRKSMAIASRTATRDSYYVRSAFGDDKAAAVCTLFLLPVHGSWSTAWVNKTYNCEIASYLLQ